MGGIVEKDPCPTPAVSQEEGLVMEAAGINMGTSWAQLGQGHLGQSHVCRPKVSGGKTEDQVAQQSTGKREVGTDLLAPPMVPAPLTSFSILVVPVATPHHIDRRTKLKQEEVK